MSRRKIPALIIEPGEGDHADLVAIIEHKKGTYLVIVDNITSEHIGAYVLEYAKQEGINLEMFLEIARQWAEHRAHPLSFELSRLGLAGAAKGMYRVFDVLYVTRVVGGVTTFDVESEPKLRRRRVERTASPTEIRPGRLRLHSTVHVSQ